MTDKLTIKLSLAFLAGTIISPLLLLSIRAYLNKLRAPIKKSLVKAIGFEMGGTSCKVAIGEKQYDAHGKLISIKIIKKHVVETRNPEETIDELIEFVKDEEYEEAGIAHFGPLCLDKSSVNYGDVTSTPKLLWQNFPSFRAFREKLSLRLKRINIETDVNAAAKAEFLLGNHNVKNSLAYITVGTGVGVGLVINGETVHGLIHPEGGHMSATPTIIDDSLNFIGTCPYHKNKCIEGLINNQSIAKRTKKSISELQNLKDKCIFWDDIAYYLANLCVNITLMCSPEVIVIGGGVMQRKILYPKIREQFKQILNGYLVHERLENLEDYIRPPKTENDCGLIGALVL